MPDYSQYIKALGKAQGVDILPDIKLPVKRKKRVQETKPRDMREARFRKEQFIPFLKKHRCQYKRIENSLPGNRGIADFIVFCLKTKWGGFVELKADDGELDEDQIIFAHNCFWCGIKYITVRTLDDMKEVVGG